MNKCECGKCEYCDGYRHDTRKGFHCNHPNQRYINNYFKTNDIRKMPGFIGYGEKFADVPKNKTTPKWCPKLAEVLDYRINQIANITDSCIYDDKSLDEALFKLLKMLKEKNNTGWIPCDSPLVPPDYCIVQIQEDNGYLWIPKVGEYRESTGKWRIEGSFEQSNGWLEDTEHFKVIAWQPLPEHYQPEGVCKDAAI